MDTQNQNQPQPDYGFILNQGDHTKGQPDGTNPAEKRKIIIFVVIFLLLLIGVISMIVGTASRGVENTSTPAVATVKTFATSVADGDYDKAYAQMSYITQPEGKTEEVTNALKLWGETFDTKNCDISQVAEKDPYDQVVATCDRKQDGQSFKFGFKVDTIDGQKKIVTYGIITDEKA